MSKFFKLKYIIVLVVVLLGVGTFFFVRNKQNGNGYDEVELVSVEVKKTVSASGDVKSTEEADLSFPTMGKVIYIGVEKGEKTTMGTYLASLNSYSSSQGAQAAKSAVDATKKDRELYIENYDSNRDAVGGFDEYEISLSKLNDLVSQAEATYQAQLGNLTNFSLNAPFDGTVVDVYYEVGETALAGQPVIKMANLDDLVFEISVDQEDFGLVKKGQKVLIMLDAYEDEMFDGIVTELPLYADQTTGDFTIKISVKQKEGFPVLLGMKGDAEIVTESVGREVTAILFDSIFEDSEGTFVWVLEDGEHKKLYVEVGLEGDLYTEIKTDLTGETIILPEQD